MSTKLFSNVSLVVLVGLIGSASMSLPAFAAAKDFYKANITATPSVLDTPNNGSCGEAYSINNLGEIIGYYCDDSGLDHPVKWDALGTPTDIAPNQFLNVWGHALMSNDVGTILMVFDTGSVTESVALINGQYIIPSLSQYGSYFVDLNNKNEIIGMDILLNECVMTPFSWANMYARLNGCDTENDVAAINNNGTIVGVNRSLDAYGRLYTALIWNNLVPQELISNHTSHDGVWDSTEATDINDKGDVIYYSIPRSPTNSSINVPQGHLIKSDGTITDLGNLGRSSSPMRINKNDQIVGCSSPEVGHWHAFLWDAGKLTDLQALTGEDGYCYFIGHLRPGNPQINDKGQAFWRVTKNNNRTSYVYSDGTAIKLKGIDGSYNATVYGMNNGGVLVGSTIVVTPDSTQKIPTKWTIKVTEQCDLDQDGVYDQRDLSKFVKKCQASNPNLKCDFDGDGLFSFSDAVAEVKYCLPDVSDATADSMAAKAFK